MQALVEGVEELAEAEETDRDRDEVDPADELRRAESEALLAGFEIDTDGADREPEQRLDHAVASAARHHDDDHADAHQSEQKIFGRPKIACHLAKEGRQERDENDP
jgi:hypothetical protein